ncbi:hypothetical protein B0H14DRAFT_2912963 [Mycena olivaceomarginata]|nr:hypothetical protein B0H14DRAFT_2912963 [Mycena olivaceomarginata]
MKLLPILLFSSAGPLLCSGAAIVFRDLAERAQPKGTDLSHFQVTVDWAKISDFASTYHAATTRFVMLLRVKALTVIYTTTDWWKLCTGNSAKFAANNPLWIARYSSSIGTLPAGWSFTTFWQYRDRTRATRTCSMGTRLGLNGKCINHLRVLLGGILTKFRFEFRMATG